MDLFNNNRQSDLLVVLEMFQLTPPERSAVLNHFLVKDIVRAGIYIQKTIRRIYKRKSEKIS